MCVRQLHKQLHLIHPRRPGTVKLQQLSARRQDHHAYSFSRLGHVRSDSKMQNTTCRVELTRCMAVWFPSDVCMCCPHSLRLHRSLPDVYPLIRQLSVPQDVLSGLINLAIISSGVRVVLSVAIAFRQHYGTCPSFWSIGLRAYAL